MSDLWDSIHQRYVRQDWIHKPSIFAQWAVQYFPAQGTILELGAGQGQDSAYFAALGHRVLSTDFSSEALRLSQVSGMPLVTLRQLDMTQPFPFEDASFSVVYAHLSVHYFDSAATKRLFSEIRRVLIAGGIVALLVNSTDDPEYGTGTRMEDDLFEVSEGFVKRFFSTASMEKFTEDFERVILDNHGEAYKDNEIGVKKLIRFVGRK
jgi:SAM-dependent methyltransferase